MLINPTEPALDIFFEPVDFLLKTIAHKMIWPDGAPEDRPAPKVACLRFVELSSQFIDAGQHVGGGEYIRAERCPEIDIFLAKIGVLKKPPEP